MPEPPRKLRVIVSTLREAAWAEIEIPGSPPKRSSTGSPCGPRLQEGPCISVDSADRPGPRGGAGDIRAEIVPHVALPVSAVRSVSVLRAWYRVAAMKA
jgi:hypothetical protein